MKILITLVLIALFVDPLFSQDLPEVSLKFSVEAKFGRYLENVDANVLSLTPQITIGRKYNARLLLDIGLNISFIQSGSDKYHRQQNATCWGVFMNVNARPFQAGRLQHLMVFGGAGIQYSNVTLILNTDRELPDISYHVKTSELFCGGLKYDFGSGTGNSEWYLIGSAILSREFFEQGEHAYGVTYLLGLGTRF